MTIQTCDTCHDRFHAYEADDATCLQCLTALDVVEVNHIVPMDHAGTYAVVVDDLATITREAREADMAKLAAAFDAGAYEAPEEAEGIDYSRLRPLLDAMDERADLNDFARMRDGGLL